MVKRIAVAELKAHLSETLRAVERGERVAVQRRGKTVAVLLPPEEADHVAGDWWTRIYGVMSDVDDFAEIMRDTVKSRARARPRPVKLED